jgi:hypothetical protein
MKNLVFIFSLALFAVGCSKQKCTEKYTISGRLLEGNANNQLVSDEPIENKGIQFVADTKGAFATKLGREELGTVYTDSKGYFSFTYECVEKASGALNVLMLSGSQYQAGITYKVDVNTDLYRDFTLSSHARVVCEIENNSNLDSLYLFVGGGVFDSGNIEGITKEKYLVVPIKNQKHISVGFIGWLDGNLRGGRGLHVPYGKSYEDMDAKNYLGREYISCQGAPYYDTVRITLK